MLRLNCTASAAQSGSEESAGTCCPVVAPIPLAPPASGVRSAAGVRAAVTVTAVARATVGARARTAVVSAAAARVARLVAPARLLADGRTRRGGAGSDGACGTRSAGPGVVRVPLAATGGDGPHDQQREQRNQRRRYGPPSPVDGGGKRPDRITQRSHGANCTRDRRQLPPHPPPGPEVLRIIISGRSAPAPYFRRVGPRGSPKVTTRFC